LTDRWSSARDALRAGRRPRILPVLVLASILLTACDRQQWSVGGNVRAPSADVAAALGDTALQNVSAMAAGDVPAIAYPRSLRPCCAFGADLQVELGRIPVPGIELGNLLDRHDLGAHRYDNGFLSIQRGDPRGAIGDERNGLVYTCRGGFIDLAHVRDNADNTLALTAAIARSLETGGVVDVPPQGATLRVRLRPVPEAAVAQYGRMPLATALAQWLAFQLSIWHETATFYGYASLPEWPEKISAFSPEDLYSNQLGARLAAGVVLGGGARSDLEYGLSMDAWIERMLERLEAVPLADSHAAMRAVDGLWWDSSKRIPDWTVVRRRRFDAGPFLAPWRLEDATPRSGEPVERVEPLARCRDSAPPLVLNVPDGIAGALFRDYAALELEVDDALVAAGFPLPRVGSRRFTQEDLPAIVAATRAANEQAFGPGADAP